MDQGKKPPMEDQPFAALDRHFADLMVRLSGETSPLPDEQEGLWLASALVSKYVGKGHVCVDIHEIAGRPLPDDGRESGPPVVCPEGDPWLRVLGKMAVIGKAGEFKPLILDDKGRLYLYRYWHYEQQLLRVLTEKTGASPPEVDAGSLIGGLKRIFPNDGEKEMNWQRVAALLAVYRRFCVISGGPGTGKTFTVARILALLIEHAKKRRPSIALAAPTGKAAARLTGMIRQIKDELDCGPEVKIFIPDEASTIHRLLGAVFGAKRFRFDERNPLPYDVVVVDEASMIDLPLMAKLVTALRSDCRLVLLGDRDQLASVEPGAVFGDLCDTGQVNAFSADLVKSIMDATSLELPCRKGKGGLLADSVVVLRKSYRFGPESGIGRLAAAVKVGDVTEALTLLKRGTHRDITWRTIPTPARLEGALEEGLVGHYRDYFSAGNLEQAFTRLNAFYLLCALRHGPYGTVAVNRMVEGICRRAGFVRGDERWYKGKPIMVTENDYHLRLFNGDVGILYPDPDAGGEPRVFFPTEGGLFRQVHPNRLSAFETVYAMTVHKSQGSEFDHVTILLPDKYSEVVTRELIYTAITRAKKTVEIWGTEDVFAGALSRTTRRQSGLREALNKGRDA